MATDISAIKKLLNSDLLDLLIRFGLIAILVVLCDRILAPFWSVLIWALILAVALYPVNQKIAAKMGNREGRAATLLVLGLIIVLGIPTVGLAISVVDGVFGLKEQVDTHTLEIPTPKESVADWPVVGEKVYQNWHLAATDLPAFVESKRPHFGELTRKILAATRSVIGTVFLFIGALIIAGVMMGYSKPGQSSMTRVFTRFAGAKGPELLNLCVATVRSVAVGVLGVAFIQSLLLGIGFVFADVPFAGVLALAALILGIVQVPAALIVIPVVAWLWMGSDNSTVMNAVWTVYLIVAGLSDNVLKPILLGRGVEAPMPVILLGALGGMLSAGFVGLFTGAVSLAVGYQIFMAWVNDGVPPTDSATGAETPEQTLPPVQP